MTKDILELTVSELSSLLRCKKLSSRELCSAYLDNIAKENSSINAFIEVTKASAMEQAELIDRRRSQGEELPPLAGIPSAIKDNICTKGIRTTCASKMLSNFVPPYNAHVMDRLSENGVITLGKTNLDEFAMGSDTETSYFKATKNPWNIDRVPGGSSGGSAAAVAAQMSPFALGSDTGGSIRQPAAFCGVVGLKPTYGRVSRRGLVSFASSLDQIGCLTKNSLDSAMILNAITGYDAGDSTCIKRSPEDFTKDIEQGVKGMRIALIKELFHPELDIEVRNSIMEATRAFEALGAEIVELPMPSLKYALPAYYVISSAEASSNLARYDGVRYGYRAQGYSNLQELYKKSRSEGFGPEVKDRIMLGTFTLSSGYYKQYYQQALKARVLIENEFEAVLNTCELILSPTVGNTVPKLNKKVKDHKQKMQQNDGYAAPVNLAGLPAISIPCGIDSNLLPIGMQLIGGLFKEKTLFQAAHAFEKEKGTFRDIKKRREASL